MNKMRINVPSNILNNIYHYKVILLVSVVIGLANLFTIQSLIGIFITLIQIFCVFILLIKKKYYDALIWHLVFITLSTSSQAAAAINGGQHALYNYAELKLFGPLRFSYFITFVLLYISYKGFRRSSDSKQSLLTTALRTFLYLAISGDIIGICGLTLSHHYSLDAFITYNVYIWMVIVTLFTIYRYCNQYLKKRIFDISLPLLSGCVFASLLGCFAGIKTSYGGHEDLPMSLDACYYASILLISILFISKHYLLQTISILAYLYLATISMSGKDVFILICAIILMTIFVFNKSKNSIIRPRQKRVGKIIIIVLLITGGLFIPKILSNGDSMTGYKIASAVSVFNGDLNEVARSPAIRIAETENIFYNNRNNPFKLFFGNGYGGYFTDELGLFIGLEVWKGGWSEKIVSSGRYPTAHDTFAVVPLCNGLIGLFLLLKLCWNFIRRIKYNYLNFAAIPWLLFTFYFSTLIAFTGIFFLIGGQYNLSKQE